MANPSFLDYLLSKEVRDRLPDLESLALALKCHQAKDSNQSIVQVADELKIGKDALYRRLAKVEELFPESSPGNEFLYGALEAMLERFYALMSGGPLKIRLGMSRALAKTVAAPVLRAFEESYPDRIRNHNKGAPDRVEIELVPGNPEALRRLVEIGDLDLIMCSCEPGSPSKASKSMSVVGEIELAMRMIVPRHHSLAVKLANRPERFEDTDLQVMTVVLLEPHPDRIPLPRYPEKLVKKAREVRYVDNYEDMHSLIKAGGDVLAFSFAELLDEDEQRRIDTITLLPEYAYRVRVCLIRSAKSLIWRSEVQQKIIRALESDLGSALQKLSDGVFNEGFIERIPKEWVLCHVGPLTADGNRFEWSEGKLMLQVTREGVVKGTHDAPMPGSPDQGRRFEIFGQAITNPIEKHQNEIQIVWQGRSSVEVYVAGFTGIRDDLEKGGNLIGAWVGRSMVDMERFRGAAGYMIAMPGKATPGIGGTALRARMQAKIELHRTRFGALALPLPGQDENGGATG